MTQDERHPREAIAVISPGQAVVRQAGEWTNREAQIIGEVLGVGLTQDDLRAYAAICRHTGFDPFQKQIYAWKDKGRLTVHIAINGWRARAASTGLYRGRIGPQWCGPDGQWRDVWLDDKKPPVAARCGIRRADAPDPVWAVVKYSEFERTQARMGAKNPTIWDEKPVHMLGIRSEYQALQAALPEVFEATRELIRQYAGANVSLDVAADEEISSVPIEIVGPQDEPEEEEPRYPWQAALSEELEVASLSLDALGALVGSPLTFAAIDSWLQAHEGATPHTLVKAAADAMAMREAKGR